VPLTLLFLGTVASRPTVERGVSSLVLVREGETLMFDCGEGTQRQMMRYGVSFALNDIFITHWHHDHFLGLLGLLRTLSLQGRTDPMRVWGPRGAQRMLRQADLLGDDRLTFPVDVQEIAAGTTIERGDYGIVTFAADHRNTAAIGYALVEHERRGRFNPDLAREMGIPEGPLWGQLHRGQTVTLPDGRAVTAESLVGPTRPGRTVVYTGDTRPCRSTASIARGADVLVHEATFADDDAERATETGHATAREAALIAAEAGVRRLILTHVSARYSRDPSPLETQAREVFPRTTVARDGMQVDVPFSDEPLNAA
jgi:ribonuclease Z